MLYNTFDSLKEAHGEDYFTSGFDDEVISNLNLILNCVNIKRSTGPFQFLFKRYQSNFRPSYFFIWQLEW